jgi:hypothetical protein
MHDRSETVISTVSSAPDRRVVIVLRRADELPIVLRTESFSADVGWFTQQSLSLSRSELQCLRNLLGVQVHRACELALNAIDAQEEVRAKVIRFDTARAVQRTA